MGRYETVVEDGTVYVATDDDRLEVGDLETIVDLVGGRAWTIRYSEREKQAHPELHTADEGLTVDVVDTVNAMTFGEAFVETLAAQPGEAATADGERDEPAEDEAADHGTDISRGDAGGQAGDVDRGDAVSP